MVEENFYHPVQVDMATELEAQGVRFGEDYLCDVYNLREIGPKGEDLDKQALAHAKKLVGDLPPEPEF